MPTNNVKIIKRKKLSFKKVLILLLVIYLIGSFTYYLITLPIKNIFISGTTYLSDVEIIEVAKIKNYPGVFKTRTSTLKKRIKTLELVKDVQIKKNIFGKLTINITENKALFYNKSKEVIVFENRKESSNINNYVGLPTLVNYVPNIVYEALIEGLAKLDFSNIELISEIEYSPIKTGDLVVDDARFLLRMNDGNHVYINTHNILKFNDYSKMYASFEEVKGTLYLDSNIEDTSSFRPFSTEAEPIEDEEDTDEQPETP